jgi:hypothetical protein
MIPYLATLTPIKMKGVTTLLFSLSLFFWGDMKSKWEERNKKGGVKCIINHQPLLWVALFFMHFSKGKGHKPQQHYYN